MRDRDRRPGASDLEPDAAHMRRRSRSSRTRSSCETVEEALDGADVVCTCTAAREPIVRHAWLAPGAHVNAVGSSVPSARELDADLVAAASLFVDRRESTLERGGRLPARRRGDGHRARPHPRRAGRAPPRRASGTERRRASSRSSSRSGSRSRISPPRRSASARARERGVGTEVAVLIPLEAIERARSITADVVSEQPAAPPDVDAPCEIWLKLECLQPIGSFKLRGATSAIRQADPAEWRAGCGRRAPATWPRASAGSPVSSASPPRSSLPITRRAPSSTRSSGSAAA